jgi:hypothetical protein
MCPTHSWFVMAPYARSGASSLTTASFGVSAYPQEDIRTFCTLRRSVSSSSNVLQFQGPQNGHIVRGLRTTRKSVPKKKKDDVDTHVDESEVDGKGFDINNQDNVNEFHSSGTLDDLFGDDERGAGGSKRDLEATRQLKRQNRRDQIAAQSAPVITQTETVYSSLADPDAVTKSWSWIPPRVVEANTALPNEGVSIPIKHQVLLTAEEIMSALEKMGGENAVKVNVVLGRYVSVFIG